jgi:hypothetical protein
LKIDTIDVKFNQKLNNVTVTLDNTDSKNTFINYTLDTFASKSFVKVVQLVTISIPEDENDREYRRVMLKTTVDLCRLGQIQSTYYAKAYMANFANTSNFEYK